MTSADFILFILGIRSCICKDGMILSEGRCIVDGDVCAVICENGATICSIDESGLPVCRCPEGYFGDTCCGMLLSM